MDTAEMIDANPMAVQNNPHPLLVHAVDLVDGQEITLPEKFQWAPPLTEPLSRKIHSFGGG